MSHQQPGQEAPETPAKKEPLPPFITDCHRNAVNRLTVAFAESRPLAIMIGEGQAGSAFVITRFLSGISSDVVTARISEPSSNAIDLMQEIVSAIGFDPKDMNLTDLEKIFSMFLSFQRSHNHRTIICVEQTQNHGMWVLDRIRQLVEMEAKGHFGLLVILSGTPALSEMLNEPPLNATCAKAGKRINLVPFSLAETKEYIRRRVEGTGAADLGQVFTFNAVTAIQEFSSGVPDKVGDLCTKCLELADLEDMAPISTALVNRASKLIRN
jgi:general secretion pathway protein A